MSAPARFSVQSIHDGSDIAVVDASPDDIAADDGFAMTHADAVELAKKSAAESRCRWFDMSTHSTTALCSDCGDWFDRAILSAENDAGDRYCPSCRPELDVPGLVITAPSFDERGQYDLGSTDKRLAATVAALRAIAIVPQAYSPHTATCMAEMQRIAVELLRQLRDLESAHDTHDKESSP